MLKRKTTLEPLNIEQMMEKKQQLIIELEQVKKEEKKTLVSQ